MNKPENTRKNAESKQTEMAKQCQPHTTKTEQHTKPEKAKPEKAKPEKTKPEKTKPEKKSPLPVIIIAGLYGIFLLVSWLVDFETGQAMGLKLKSFALDMFKIVPFAFILIGLFEVWVKRETIERHLGEDTVYRGYFWAILLAGTTVGGLYVAFPVACALYRKGARLSVIFTYLGTSGTCRIPMTVFEASFLGLPFTLTRLFTAVPLVILSSILLEKWLKKQNYAPNQVGE